MAKLLKLRRGTTSQHNSFTGAEGEVTVDTDKEILVVHDGSTAGGHAVAAEDMANVSSADIVGRLGTGSIVKAKLEADIIDSTKLADDSVNSEHYVDNSIDQAHISSGAVGTSQLADTSINNAKLATNAVTEAKITDAAVTHVKLANDCIDGDNIQNDVVNSEHIAAGAVDLEHMSSESVDEDNLKISNSGSNGQFLSKQSGNAGGLTWAAVDLSPYAPLAAPALTGTATGVNLTLSGNLTVNGTTTTVATTNTTLTDNLLELNSGAGSNANDAGILIERGSTGDNAIIAWDESADKFTVGTTTGTASSTGNISITTGTLVANVEGNGSGITDLNATNLATGTVNPNRLPDGIKVNTSNTNSTFYPIFMSGSAGNNTTMYTDGGQQLQYNPSTNVFTAGTFSGTVIQADDIQGAGSDGTINRLKWDRSANKLTLDDGVKIGLGSSGTDCELYHDGTDTYITNTTGELRITDSSLIRVNTDDFRIYKGDGTELTFRAEGDGACSLYYDNAKKFETTASGVTVTGTVTDSKGDVRKIIINSKSSAYTLVAADAGKAIYTSSGGVTVPNSVFSAGDAITIINNSGSDQTITQGSNVTLYNTADASTGNRTLAQRGMATMYFAGSSTAYISGAGLS